MPERLSLHKKWPELTPDERTAILDYLVNTCLLHGSTTGTAYTVAGLFSDGLDRVRDKLSPDGYPASTDGVSSRAWSSSEVKA